MDVPQENFRSDSAFFSLTSQKFRVGGLNKQKSHGLNGEE